MMIIVFVPLTVCLCVKISFTFLKMLYLWFIYIWYIENNSQYMIYFLKVFTIYFSIYLSIYLPIHLSNYLSVYICIYLSIYLWCVTYCQWCVTSFQTWQDVDFKQNHTLENKAKANLVKYSSAIENTHYAL